MGMQFAGMSDRERIEALLSGDDASAGMQFAGMQFAGVDPAGRPLYCTPDGRCFPLSAAGFDLGQAANLFLNPFAVPQMIAQNLMKPAPAPHPAAPVFHPAAAPVQPFNAAYHQALINQAAAARAAQTPIVFNQDPSKKQRYQFGFDSGSTLVAPGATFTQSIIPQMPMKILKLSSPSTDWIINDIKIGTKSQFAANTSVPVESFGPTALGNEVDFEVVSNGYSVFISATNIGAGATRFLMTAFGEVVF